MEQRGHGHDSSSRSMASVTCRLQRYFVRNGTSCFHGRSFIREVHRLWLSRDDGETWHDAGGTIAGIHAAVAQLGDGRLLAFGRGDEIDGMMPMSTSNDMGATWTYAPSVFPPVHTGQRPLLFKLKTGELFFAAFSNDPETEHGPSSRTICTSPTELVRRPVRGLYCALSLMRKRGSSPDRYRRWAEH